MFVCLHVNVCVPVMRVFAYEIVYVRLFECICATDKLAAGSVRDQVMSNCK